VVSYDNNAANDNDAGQGGAAEPVQTFALADNPGLLVNVDDEDNEAGHVILHSDAGTKVSFAAFNMGTVAGTCTVDIAVDGTVVKQWASSYIEPGQSESAEVKGLGRYPKGSHDFTAQVTPGDGGHYDNLKNGVDILDP
jgi:hypothetical protein